MMDIKLDAKLFKYIEEAVNRVVSEEVKKETRTMADGTLVQVYKVGLATIRIDIIEPTPEEGGGACWAGSEVYDPPCTIEYSETCPWAKERREWRAREKG